MSDKGIEQVLTAVKEYGPDVEQYKQLGKIKASKQDDLLIFNYTAECQYHNEWTPVERVCRGLIVHWPTATIAARPFDKFFNLNQTPGTHLDELSKDNLEITVKLDGSMGLTYKHSDGQYAIATRGSFDSEQARWATNYLRSFHGLYGLPDNVTLIFEIIYPNNRIVVDYGQSKDLVLIGARNLDGYDYPYDELEEIAKRFGLSIVQRVVESNIDDLLAAAAHRTNIEGWVVRWPDGLRVKIKTDEYRRLHRIITNLSPARVRDEILAGTFDAMVASVPADFQVEINAIADAIKSYADTEQRRIEQIYWSLEPLLQISKKSFALAVIERHKDDQKYLFALSKGLNIRPMIIKDMDLTAIELAAV